MIKNILTVCVGNICRSPMGEVLLKERLHHLDISSAGIGALVGHRADKTAIELMERRGLDISAHRARQINLEMCKRSDIILVMEELHRTYILDHYPFTQGKVFRLGEHQKNDIPDPYRQSHVAFEYALELISVGVNDWCTRISKL